MTYAEAVQTLDSVRALNVTTQMSRRAEAIAAFKTFWASEPDEKTFSRHTGGLVVFPELLYVMSGMSGASR